MSQRAFLTQRRQHCSIASCYSLVSVEGLSRLLLNFQPPELAMRTAGNWKSRKIGYVILSLNGSPFGIEVIVLSGSVNARQIWMDTNISSDFGMLSDDPGCLQ